MQKPVRPSVADEVADLMSSSSLLPGALMGLLIAIVMGAGMLASASYGVAEPTRGKVVAFQTIGPKRPKPMIIVRVEGGLAYIRDPGVTDCPVGSEIELQRRRNQFGKTYAVAPGRYPCRRATDETPAAGHG